MNVIASTLYRTHDPESIQTLKSSTCPSISGATELTYEIGCDDDKKIYFRITNNSGGGFFNADWVSLDDIQALLSDRADGANITSFHLYPLFRGKSVNTPTFILAVLKHEGLVQPMVGNWRVHELKDPKTFLGKATKLMSAAEKKISASAKSKARSTKQ